MTVGITSGMVASEVRNPQRNLPLALIGGTAGVIAIYMLANWAYFRVLSPAEVGAHKLVAAEMMQRISGGWGASAVSIAAMISIFAALNGSILTGARVPYAAARDGLFFRSAARVHPAFHTPGVSILMLSAWSSVLVLSGKYEELFDFVIFGSWILYAMATASVFVLRRKRPDLKRPYRTFGYPVVPFFFLAGATVLEISTLWTKPRAVDCRNFLDFNRITVLFLLEEQDFESFAGFGSGLNQRWFWYVIFWLRSKIGTNCLHTRTLSSKNQISKGCGTDHLCSGYGTGV